MYTRGVLVAISLPSVGTKVCLTAIQPLITL